MYKCIFMYINCRPVVCVSAIKRCLYSPQWSTHKSFFPPFFMDDLCLLAITSSGKTVGCIDLFHTLGNVAYCFSRTDTQLETHPHNQQLIRLLYKSLHTLLNALGAIFFFLKNGKKIFQSFCQRLGYVLSFHSFPNFPATYIYHLPLLHPKTTPFIQFFSLRPEPIFHIYRLLHLTPYCCHYFVLFYFSFCYDYGVAAFLIVIACHSFYCLGLQSSSSSLSPPSALTVLLQPQLSHINGVQLCA